MFLLSPLLMWAQDGINYQAVVRDAGGLVMANQSVTADFKILQTSATGTVVYEETHAPTTNEFGLINVVIGEGSVVTGTFDAINWGSDIYFLDITLNGTNVGTVEFKWVPYALHAKTLTNVTPNTANADVEITSADDYALVHIHPNGATTNDSSTLFLGEGSTPENGMALTYDGVGNTLKIIGSTFADNYMGPYLIIDRDSGTSTFTKGVEVQETTTAPAPNTVYGNSGPLAYCYISGATLITDFGVTSVTSSSTGVYNIIIDNDWTGSPVIIATSLNTSSDTEIITYSFSGTNSITVRIVDENNTPTDSNFSVVVYGVAQ